MLELFQESIAVVNLPYTIFFALILIFWAFYISGAVSSEILDFDLGGGGDMDLDLDVDADVGEIHHSHAGVLKSISGFFLFGEVPSMIIFTILITTMWSVSIMFNHWTGNQNGTLALLLFIPNFILGLSVTKVILWPFVPMLKKVFNEQGDVVQVVGKSCIIKSLTVNENFGQAEMQMDGAPLLLNVKTREGEVLSRGDEAIIYEFDKDKHIYYITKMTDKV